MSTDVTKQVGDQEQLPAHHDSEEYESAEEVEEVSYEDDEVEEVEVEVEEEVEDDEASEDAKEKEVDEDRKNPQFIPKKGYFYEHDDRTVPDEGIEEEEEPSKPERPKPKPATKDPGDRWTHDLYDEEEQAPKTRAELSGRYGYDIRSEDQAPRARRRRRYGRGPNKYTRKWEEEEAYQKPRGGFRGRGVGRGRNETRQSTRATFDEEFPELGSSNTRRKSTEEKPKNIDPKSIHQPPTEGGEDVGSGRTNDRRDRGKGRFSERERHDGEMRQRGGNRGWGRRNEFSNRNRYPDKRGSDPEKDYNTASSSAGKSLNSERQTDKIVQKESRKSDEPQKDYDKAVPPNRLTTTSDSSFGRNFPNSGNNASKQPGRSRNPPPFTNTEYKGSESLAAPRPKHHEQERGKFVQSESDRKEEFIGSGSKMTDTFQRDRDDHDARRSVNSYQTDRRGQIPPRLQQQQQQQQQLQQQQAIDPGLVASKPKRFSTQRQRQNLEQTMVMGSGPNQVGPPLASIIATGAGQKVPSAVPVSSISSYSSSQGYYDPVPSTYEAQVYGSGSGSSVSVSGGNHPPSVTPSMWVPHSSPYVAAPYPSPPAGPQVPQPSYNDPSAFLQATQQGGPLFAPPHPQFIQDPTILNYVPPVPPPTFGPSFHASGFQGYAQVAPPPPPELYHGGVTYYSTQNQMPRAHIPVMSKRPKTVLQLVEPPDKKDLMRQYSGHGNKQSPYDVEYNEPHVEPTVVDPRRPHTSSVSSYQTAVTETAVKISSEPDVTAQLSSLKLEPEPERVKKSPSPAPLDLTPEKSWSEQMNDDITPVSSPTEVHNLDNPLNSDSVKAAQKQELEQKQDASDPKVSESDQVGKVEADQVLAAEQ